MPESIFSGTPRLSEWQRQLIGMLPYVGPVYTAGRGVNALAQFIGRQFGNKPGALPTNSETNNPPMYGPDTATAVPGTLPTNSQTNNPPMYGQSGAQPGTGQPYDMNGILSMWAQHFPSSALARFAPSSTQTVAQQRNAAGLGTPSSVFTGLSGPAVDALAEVRRRNLQ